ncbi:MAG: hypothetical protein EOP55_12110 [Sphingobacteriales bacterium]|nr:MAG: hypothetical protein EOP55_12110 [Sphingobacteriales bacterium]
MKKFSSLLVIALFFAACQNKQAETTESVSKADTTKYPYEVKKVEDWEMNKDTKNLVTSMTLIKTFESLDTASMGKVLADSVWFTTDGYQFKGTKSQFLKQIKEEFGKMTSFKINMQDYESVINKDKSEEWVSLWYSQISTAKDGKTDTVNLFNDVKLKYGKVIGLSEYIQHPMKK